jgi:DeoR/GlpR family transcriptional regulator of sugar metabolism
MGQAALKTMMAARSIELFVLADHTKLGYEPFTYMASLDMPFTLITDDGATPEQLQPFIDHPGVRVQVASVQQYPITERTGAARL